MSTQSHPNRSAVRRRRTMLAATGLFAISSLVVAEMFAAASFQSQWYSFESAGGGAMVGGAFEVTSVIAQTGDGRMQSSEGGLEVIGGFGGVLTNTERHWSGASSGALTDVTKWDDRVVPEAFDVALFDQAVSNPIAATLTEPLSVGKLAVVGRRLRLRLIGADLHLNDDTGPFPSLLIGGPQIPTFTPELELEKQGAQPATLFAKSTSVGDAPNRSGLLTVRGQSAMTQQGTLAIGRKGFGTMNVRQQSLLASFGAVTVAESAGSDGKIYVQDVGSLWSASGVDPADEFILGRKGSGELEISSGASAFAGGFSELILGLEPGSSGKVTVIGPSAIWILDQPVITVGPGGTGEIELIKGGVVSYGGGGALDGGIPPIYSILPKGTLRGDGTIVGNIVNSGLVKPEGTLTIDGEFDQSVGGTLWIRIGNVLDRLIVTKFARLGGTLFVEVPSGWMPTAGMTFDFFVASGLDAAFKSFGVTQMPSLAGLRLRLQGGQGDGVVAFTIVVEALDAAILLGQISQVLSIANGPTDLVVADMDGNGIDDILVSAKGATPSTPGKVYLVLNQGGTTPPIPLALDAGLEPRAIAVADLTGNGLLDIAVANEGSDTVSVFYNLGGSGNFTFPATIPVGDGPVDLVAGHVGNEARPSIVVVNSGSDSVQVLQNNGFGSLTPLEPLSVGPDPVGIAGGSLSGSGTTPFVVAVAGSSALVTLAAPFGVNPSGLVISGGVIVPFVPSGVATEELDPNKQSAQVIAMSSASGNIMLSKFDPATGLQSPGVIPLGAAPRSLTAIDLNGNTLADLAIVVDDPQGGSFVKILRNDSVPGSDALVLVDQGSEYLGTNPLLIADGDVSGTGLPYLVTVNSGGPSGVAGGACDLGFCVQVRAIGQVPGDINGDGLVNGNDLAQILGNWGPCADCAADVTGNGIVDGGDLAIVLGNWTG